MLVKEDSHDQLMYQLTPFTNRSIDLDADLSYLSEPPVV